MKHSLKKTLALVLSLLLVFSSVASATSLLDKLKEKKNEKPVIEISGIYYGSFQFYDCAGSYEKYEDMVFDAVTLIVADEEGKGEVRIYLNGSDSLLLTGSCSYEEDAILVKDLVYYGLMDGEDLRFEKTEFADLYACFGSCSDVSGGEDAFSYTLLARPYGAMWEDVAMDEGASLLLPPGYADYLDYLAEGMLYDYLGAYSDLEEGFNFSLTAKTLPLYYVQDQEDITYGPDLFDLGEEAQGSIEFSEDGSGLFCLGSSIREAFSYDETSLYFEDGSEAFYTVMPGGELHVKLLGEEIHLVFCTFSRYGRYIPVDAYIGGEYQKAPEGAEAFAVDIYPDGKAFVWSEGEYTKASYTEDSLTEEEETLNLQFFNGWLCLDDGETLIRFVRDSYGMYSFLATDEQALLNHVFISEYQKLEVDTEFYGTMLYENFEDLGGGNSYGDLFDVRASFASTRDGELFFEVYDYEEPDKVIFSAWVDQEENVLYPVIGEEDAWIYDMYFKPEQAEALTMEMVNGAIEFSCLYEQEGVERIEIRFFLRPVGSLWDEENDPLPPSYEDYANEYYAG